MEPQASDMYCSPDVVATVHSFVKKALKALQLLLLLLSPRPLLLSPQIRQIGEVVENLALPISHSPSFFVILVCSLKMAIQI